MHKREGVAELTIKIQQLRSTVGCLVGCLQVVRQYKPTGECGIDIVGNPFARIQPKIRVRDFFGADFAEIRGAERFWRSPRRCRAGLRAGRGRKGRRSGTGAKDQ